MELRNHTIIAALALLTASCAKEETNKPQISDIQVAITADFATPAADFAAAGMGVGCESAANSPIKGVGGESATDFAAAGVGCESAANSPINSSTRAITAANSAVLTASRNAASPTAENSAAHTASRNAAANSAAHSADFAETKATATAFESGDLLGLYAVKSGGELNAASNLINNHQIKVGANGEIVGVDAPAYYPDKSSSLDLFSYFPYQSGNATADALGVLVGIRTHQTDFSSLMASDLCYGQKLDAAPTAAPHPLQFRHSFAQLRLNFSLYDGCSAIATVKLLKIKDQAKLNLQTGVVTLLSSVADVDPYVNSADATNPLSFTAIIPAQYLSGPCVEITLKDGTIYYYHAVTPIPLKAAATNTLNLRIADRKVVTASGAPVVAAWGAVTSSGTLTESVNNLVTLYWLAPHASYAAVDKITVSLVDIFNRSREVEVTPTLDPLSSAEYATYTFPLILGSDASYPQIIENLKLYAGSTLLRDSPRVAIIGSVLTKAGAHTIGLNLAIEISPREDWLDVSGYGDSKTITVTTAGTTEWTATSTHAGLTITKPTATTALLTWATHAGVTAPAARSATVTFATSPAGATATLTSTQNGVLDRIKIGNLWWAIGNLVADGTNSAKIGAPTDGGLYFQFGSLVGWSMLDPLAIAVKPAGCSVTAWNGSWTGNPATQNLTTGTGDPCRFYLGGTWRLPTSAEFLAAGNYQVWTTNGSTAGRWFGPTGGWSSANAVFFPASGRRSTSGALNGVGANGFYWSSSVSSSSNGYVLYFFSSSVSPQTIYSRAYCFTVRCVSN